MKLKVTISLPDNTARIISSILLLVSILLPTSRLWSQQNDATSRRQRAIFIYNFAQQVEWPKYAVGQKFRIGVLGNDPILNDLVQLGKGRNRAGKAYEIRQCKAIDDINGLELLYVSKDFNFDIKKILKTLAGKYTLLVGGDYGFRESMVNLVEVEGKVLYEVNETLIRREGLKVSPALVEGGITSVERWQELYAESKASLNVEKQKVQAQIELVIQQEKELAGQRDMLKGQRKALEEQETSLKEQEGMLSEQGNKISKQKQDILSQQAKIGGFNDELDQLAELNEIQQSKLGEKTAILAEQENQISDHQLKMDGRNNEMKGLNVSIETKNAELKEQEERIRKQRDILGEQTLALEEKQIVMYLLIAISFLGLVLILNMFRNSRTRAKINARLSQKNKAIALQSQQLEQKNQELEQFAYIASHDLQEPLRTVMNFTEVLLEDYDEALEDEGKMYLNLIVDSSKRMSGLIKDLLDYSRLGRERVFKTVNTRKLVADVTKDLSALMEENKAKIQVGSIPEVTGLEVELRMLFQNLINNGIKFRDHGRDPVIKISAELENGFWKFVIQDNGIGIETKAQSRIFVMFQRLHSQKEYKGTGIGLAHCKKIVDSHGGNIWVSSIPGVGSTFFFTIPDRNN